MSASGIDLKTCADGRQVFQLLYPGAPDACAAGGSTQTPAATRGFGSLPTQELIQNLPPWLTGTDPQPSTTDTTPAPEETEEKECSCKKGRKSGENLLLMLLTLLWLTS